MQGKEAAPPRLELVSGASAPAAPTVGDSAAAFLPASTVMARGRFCETKALKARLAAAQHTLRSGDTVVMVVGEKGAGKTTFLRRLIAGLAPRTEICDVAARYPVGERHILARVEQAFNIGDTRSVAGLAAHLTARAARAPIAIVVDDAHNLSPFALRVLFDLKRAMRQAGGRLGLVVAARPKRLQAMLALPSFAAYAKDWTTRFELPRFGEQEIREYLRHRIEASDAREHRRDPTNAEIRSLRKRSKGLPAQISRMAEDILSGNGLQRRFRAPDWSSTGARGFLAAAGVVLAGVTFAYLSYAIFFTMPQVERTIAAPLSGADGGSSLAASSPQVTARAPDALDVSAETDMTAAARGLAAPLPAAVDGSQAPALAAASPVPVPQSRPEPAAAPPVSRAGPLARDTAWLMAQDPEQYTIQLVSTPDHSGALEFIDKYPLGGKTVVVETMRGATFWYVVLHNTYASAVEARSAVDGLPREIRRNDPFPRRIQSIQAIAATR